LLLGVLREDEGIGAQVLKSRGISYLFARSKLFGPIEPYPAAAQAAGHIPFNPGAKKALELSLREALQLGHNFVGTEHILLGLVRNEELHSDRRGPRFFFDNGLGLNGARKAAIQLIATSDTPPLAPQQGTHLSRLLFGELSRLDEEIETKNVELRDLQAAREEVAAALARGLQANPPPSTPTPFTVAGTEPQMYSPGEVREREADESAS
jgi:hypothetical protein